MHFSTGRMAGMAAATCMLISSFLAVLVYFSVVIDPYPEYTDVLVSRLRL
jgi:hypothetical protein